MSNFSNRSFTPRRQEGPRKVRGGIKLAGLLQSDASEGNAAPTSQSFTFEKSRQLLSLITTSIDAPILAAGLEYARSGQTVSIEIKPGLIDARIQGAAAKPYVTEIGLPVLSHEQWQSVIELMAGEAVYVAKLLAGELPSTLDELLTSLNLRLGPESSDQLVMRCTCGASVPCKHLATLAHIAAERLATFPLLWFTLLGMPSEQLLEQLRQARTIQTHGFASAHGESAMPVAQVNSMPLEACIDDFWRSPQQLQESEISATPRSHHVPHALLRRLGPSPLSGRFPLVGLLASVYDTVSEAARKVRDQATDNSPTS